MVGIGEGLRTAVGGGRSEPRGKRRTELNIDDVLRTAVGGDRSEPKLDEPRLRTPNQAYRRRLVREKRSPSPSTVKLGFVVSGFTAVGLSSARTERVAVR